MYGGWWSARKTKSDSKGEPALSQALIEWIGLFGFGTQKIPITWMADANS